MKDVEILLFNNKKKKINMRNQSVLLLLIVRKKIWRANERSAFSFINDIYHITSDVRYHINELCPIKKEKVQWYYFCGIAFPVSGNFFLLEFVHC